MRVPSNTLFNQQTYMLTQQYEKMVNYNANLASGKKLLRSSEDPVLASRIRQTNTYISNVQAYDNNGILAKSRTEAFINSSSSMSNLISRAKELIIQAGNDTYSNENRAATAQELSGYMNTMLGIANSKDGNGEYIYAGFNSNTQPFIMQGNSYVYQGGYQSTQVDIGLNTSTTYSESGYDVFGNIPTGNGSFTISANPANTGTAYTELGGVSSGGAYVPDTYTLTFVTNSSGELAYQVVGATSGQVIPTPPATAPANAPAFQANSSISFNGVTFKFTGTPQVGDQFTVAPSQGKSIFNSMNDLITLLKTPITNDVEKAQFQQKLNQFNGDFTQMFNSLASYQTTVGTRAGIIDDEITANDNLKREQTTILSGLEDIDFATAASRLTQQQLALQVSQQGYLRIQNVLMQLLQM